MTDDPFAQIGDSKKPRLRVVGGNAELVCVVPAPKDAPRFPTRHPKLGEPSLTWAYRSAAGEFLGEIWRFSRGAEKEFRPVTLWRNAKGQLEWRFQIWPELRPLYGLDRLGARPGLPVIVTEGEKAADAAVRQLPSHVAVAWPGGANAPAKADWTPLRGRVVVVWPDADAPGLKCAAAVAKLALAAGAASVSILTPPDGAAAGWDAADAEAEGWPLSKLEALIKAAQSSGASDAAKGKRPPAGDADAPKRGVAGLVRLVDERAKCLFHDAAGRAYAAVTVGEHVENLPILSKTFGGWLSLASHAEGLTPPNKSTLGDTQRIFEARALSEGPLKQPFPRVGARGDKIYVNMADAAWRVIEVGPKGWTVLDVHDLPNIRSAAMLPLVKPQETDEGIEILRRFVNADEGGFRLIVAWLLAALYPAGPFPILIVNGEQGSAKSSLTRLLRNLIDPNFAPLRAMPKEETDIIVAAMHAHVIALDNVSTLSGEMSDALCRAATGGGMSARAKYSDADEFVAYVKAPIVINGIPALANRPDLASRSLIVRLESIPDDARMTEGELEEEWAKVAPRVLAILLDALSAALARLPQTRPPKISRMADFERLIEAASPFLGWEPGEFAEIYRANQSESDAAAIEADPIAGAIVDMVRDDHTAGWEGTMSRLLEILSTKVSEAVRRSRLWPATAGSLGMRLDRVKPILRRHGVGITRWHSGERRIRIFPTSAPQSAPPVSPAPDA